MKKGQITVTALAAVQACAPPAVKLPIPRWSQPSASYDDFLRDRFTLALRMLAQTCRALSSRVVPAPQGAMKS